MGARTVSGEFQPKGSHFIGGNFADDDAGLVLESRHPATNAVIASLHEATDVVLDRAITAAQQAQPAWAATAPRERGRILQETARLLRARNDAIARVETADTGKAIQETLVVDVASAADNLDYFGQIIATLTTDHIPVDENCFAYTLREPFGIVGAMGAWNYPLQTATWKAAPALAAGNALVYKPSEMTPLTALILAETLVEAGLPAGLFNVIQGAGSVGAKLTSDPRIDKLSLTGSVPTGIKVAHAGADRLAPVTLELGGKSPLIVFDDAHLENAVSGAIMGNFYSTGQVCSNSTRVFVQKSLKDTFTERLVERTRAIKIGDPFDPDTQMGPMVSARQLEIVEGYIAKGREEGANLLTGGGRPALQGLENGHFIEPTIFDDVSDDMTIAREEIFGPVLSLFTFDDENEAISRANATPFGLAAGVFTKDTARAHRVVRQLQAGTTYINNFNLTPVGVPFGGHKMSGLGRENAKQALDSYSQIKSVYVELGDVEAGY